MWPKSKATFKERYGRQNVVFGFCLEYVTHLETVAIYCGVSAPFANVDIMGLENVRALEFSVRTTRTGMHRGTLLTPKNFRVMGA